MCVCVSSEIPWQLHFLKNSFVYNKFSMKYKSCI